MRIPCPHCGPRDENEFSFRGDATVSRPRDGADAEAFVLYVYERRNPRGWHAEWWQHAAGCRQWFKLVRNTLTHEIRAALPPSGTPDLTP